MCAYFNRVCIFRWVRWGHTIRINFHSWFIKQEGYLFFMFRPIREVVIQGGGGQSIQRIIIMTIHNLKKNVNILNYHSIIMQRPRIIWNFPFYRDFSWLYYKLYVGWLRYLFSIWENLDYYRKLGIYALIMEHKPVKSNISLMSIEMKSKQINQGNPSFVFLCLRFQWIIWCCLLCIKKFWPLKIMVIIKTEKGREIARLFNILQVLI